MLVLDEAIRNMLNSANIRTDANGVGFFETQLQSVIAEIFEVDYPELKATQLMPVDTSADPGAETIAYFMYDKVGIAKIIADYADDLPAVFTTRQKNVGFVRGMGNHFKYSIQDIRAAQMANVALENLEAMAAREAFEQLLNRIAWQGDDEYKLLGLLNNPNIPESSVPNDGTGASTKFEDKTPAQILRDLNTLVREIKVTTLGIEMPDTVIMPVEQLAYIQQKPYSEYSATSIYSYFIANNPSIKTVTDVNELKGAGSGGEDVMMAFKQDRTRFRLQIPQPFETFPPQAWNLIIKVATHGRCGGVNVMKPLSLNKKLGI